MATYNINTRTRARVAYRSCGRMFLQYIPLVCDIYLCVMCAYYVIVEPPATAMHDHTLAYMIAGHIVSAAWYFFVLGASYCFGFCRLHRALITYAYIATLMMYCDRWYGFGALSNPSIWVTLTAGVALIGYTLHKIIRKHYGC